MREKKRSILLACLMAVFMVASASSTAWAQFDDDIPETADEKKAKEADAARSDMSYHAGNLEFMLGGSLGGLFYPELELGGELGILPLGDMAVVSVGAVGRVGYCIVCLGANFVTGGVLDLRAWNISAMGRAGVHLPVLGESFGIPELDVSGGLIAGPSYYNVQVKLQSEGDSAFVTQQLIAFSIGPYVALRYMFSEAFFVGFDYRLLYVFSEEDGSVRINDQTYDISYDDFVQAGGFYNAYIGIRF